MFKQLCQALVLIASLAGMAAGVPVRGERASRSGSFGEPVRYYVTADAPGTHVTTPGVPAFGVNVDGVCVVDNWTQWWMGSGALISDRHVLTAGHMGYPGDDFEVWFDLPAGPVSIQSVDFIPHPLYLDDEVSWGSIETGFDIAIIELAEDAPPEVPRYPIYTGTGEVGVVGVKSGYGDTGDGWTGATFWDGAKRAGLNLYDTTGEDTMARFASWGAWPVQPGAYLAYDFDSGLPDNDAFGYVGLPELGYGPDEVNSAPGDSGGPTFINDGGQWKVAGVTSWGIGFNDLPDASPGTTDSSFGELSFDSRVSSYADFINSILTGVPLDGGFKGSFAPASWFIYDDAGGSVDFSQAPYRVRLTGGDSGIQGVTYFTTLAPAPGTVAFDWNYGTWDDPEYDVFGYFRGLDAYVVTDGWELFGSVSFPVSAGEEFGFWLYTEDGLYGEGVANVYNFSFVIIPEPSTLALCVLFGLSAAVRRRRRARL